MKTIIIVMSIVSILVLLSTLICGLWINGQETADVSSVNFHRTIALISTVLSTITMVIAIIGVSRLS